MQINSFLDLIWAMLVFFFWFMAIWIFIQIFADVFRRSDLSGWSKALWTLFLIILPFLGALIYIIARPKVTAQDVEMLTRAEAAQSAASQVSAADELSKLEQLRQAGVITEPEFNQLKAKLV